MTPVRAASLAIVLVLGSAGGAMAEMLTGTANGPSQGPRASSAPCMAEVARSLGAETEKRAAALKAAVAKHVSPQELCQLFADFLESEGVLVKFLEKNASSCGIPTEIVTTGEADHTRSAKTGDKVCGIAWSAANEARGGPVR